MVDAVWSLYHAALRTRIARTAKTSATATATASHTAEEQAIIDAGNALRLLTKLETLDESGRQRRVATAVWLTERLMASLSVGFELSVWLSEKGLQRCWAVEGPFTSQQLMDEKRVPKSREFGLVVQHQLDWAFLHPLAEGKRYTDDDRAACWAYINAKLPTLAAVLAGGGGAGDKGKGGKDKQKGKKS